MFAFECLWKANVSQINPVKRVITAEKYSPSDRYVTEKMHSTMPVVMLVLSTGFSSVFTIGKRAIKKMIDPTVKMKS
jgi:hypothetical protein